MARYVLVGGRSGYRAKAQAPVPFEPQGRINPAKLGFTQAGNVFSGRVRIEMKPGHMAKRGFSTEVTLSFELRSGFIAKRTLRVNGKPLPIGESRLRRLNGALAWASRGQDSAIIGLSPDMIEALTGKSPWSGTSVK